LHRPRDAEVQGHLGDHRIRPAGRDLVDVEAARPSPPAPDSVMVPARAGRRRDPHHRTRRGRAGRSAERFDEILYRRVRGPAVRAGIARTLETPAHAGIFPRVGAASGPPDGQRRWSVTLQPGKTNNSGSPLSVSPRALVRQTPVLPTPPHPPPQATRACHRLPLPAGTTAPLPADKPHRPSHPPSPPAPGQIPALAQTASAQKRTLDPRNYGGPAASDRSQQRASGTVSGRSAEHPGMRR
jgi:hypothetical protein